MRDFRRAVFKYTTTAPSAKPLRHDLAATLERGIPPTMPAIGLLSDDKVQDVVERVVWLAQRGEVERRLVAALVPGDDVSRRTKREAVAAVGEEWSAAESQVTVKAKTPPALTPELARWGRALFASKEAACAACHGADGRGPGPTARELVDAWGQPDPPPDLSRGAFPGGGSPADLYRSIAAGLKGTPMPGYQEALGSEQIWDLVAYLRELGGERGR